MYHKRGFTLIELLVVVLIIGILSAIALPQYQVAVAKSRYARGRVLVDAVWNAQQVYYMANGKYAPRFEDLDISLPAGLKHVYAPGENGDDQYHDGKYWYDIRVDNNAGSYVYMRINDKAKYLRNFKSGPAKCYAGNALWDKVCLSLGGKLTNNTPGMHIYDLP